MFGTESYEFNLGARRPTDFEGDTPFANPISVEVVHAGARCSEKFEFVEKGFETLTALAWRVERAYRPESFLPRA